MTGTSMGKTFMDFDCNKNQEWLRRRKLRLEQVRKQSNEIAKALRQKVIDDQKARLEECGKINEEKFKDWKAEKLVELERKLRCALEEFGKGYKLAETEPVPEVIIEERNKLNLVKAQKRGEIAKEEEFRKRKMAEGKKMIPIQRKIMTRKREDLRSALVRSVVLKKHLIDAQEAYGENDHETVLVKKKFKKKKTLPQKSCICNYHATVSQASPYKNNETIWINLNDVQLSSAGDSGLQSKNSKSSLNTEKSQKENSEGAVEYYDFSSRYRCRLFKELPHLVERIEPEAQMLNANELATLEDEETKYEIKKKFLTDSVVQERGMEALRREKIKREYNNLLARLEELNKREKILKMQHRFSPSFLHMNDERLTERVRAKQRIMETEFEKIYYEATSQIPHAEVPDQEAKFSQGGGDYVLSDNQLSVRLSFSPSNLKLNTPVSSEEGFSSDFSTKEACRRMKKTKKRRQLLSDIDKALREGRELRKTIARYREANISEDGEKEEEKEEENEVEEWSSDGSSKAMETRIVEPLLPKDKKKTTKIEESSSEDLKHFKENVVEDGLKEFDKAGDDSLPVSSSTSYKSPPSVITSYRLRQVLDYLEKVSQEEDDTLMQSKSKFKRKMEKLLWNLMSVDSNSKSEEKDKKSCISPTLKYYIEKLLNMSRECIADLSVSSEHVSTPNVTDLDVKDEKAAEAEHCSRISLEGENLIRNSRLERANQLEQAIKNWKKILEKNSEEFQLKAEDVADCPHPEILKQEALSEIKPEEAVLYSPKIKNKYEEITKKCSARISKLSNMLDRVRKDKEKLLSSGGSNSSLCKDDKVSKLKFNADEEEELLRVPEDSSENLKTSPVLEDFISRYNLTRPKYEISSTAAVADSQSPQEPEESLESWPDVMDELLRREILTSPFKWSDADDSSEFAIADDSRTKPPSIEIVIGNFRKEISKIKRFSLLDSFPQSNLSEKPRHAPEKEFKELFSSPHKSSLFHCSATENELFCPEESSGESINYALTRLGLNWAKSFLRKNEESRAMCSSSNSEEKCSEKDNYL